jgi:hypothetical protein
MTAASSCGQQINDVFDSFVGPMVRGLEATVGSVLRIGSMASFRRFLPGAVPYSHANPRLR